MSRVNKPYDRLLKLIADDLYKVAEVDDSGAERVADFRERQHAMGLREVLIWLPEKAITKMKEEGSKHDMSMEDMGQKIILEHFKNRQG